MLQRPSFTCVDHMNSQLAQLISDYQESVRAALQLIRKSGAPLPLTCTDWVDTDIPQSGELDGGIPYYKHGYGCTVSLPTGDVDFDFGENGEIDGFDLWRLSQFSISRQESYGFDTKDELKESFDYAVKRGWLVSSGYILYYVADSMHLLPDKVREILSSNALPHQDRDSVLALYAQCFLSADLMRNHYLKIDRQWKKDGRLSQTNRINFRVYLHSWLGYLRATCEGFEKLGMRLLLLTRRPDDFQELVPKCDEVSSFKKQHGHDLKELRNSIFHLRADNVSAP